MNNLTFLNKEAIDFDKSLYPSLQSLCTLLQNYLGITNFIYTKFLSNGSRVCVTNRPHWIQNSIEGNVHESKVHVDQLINFSHQDKFTYFVRTGMPTNDVLEGLYNNNLWNGLSLCKKNSSNMELFSFFGGRNCGESCLNFLINNTSTLEKFCMHFKKKLPVDLDNLDQVKLVYPKTSLLFDFSSKNKISTNNIDKLFSEDGLQLDYKGKCIKLSPREQECMNLIYQGKSAKIMAAHIGISPRTVEKYMESLKLKFNVTSKFTLASIVHDIGGHI